MGGRLWERWDNDLRAWSAENDKPLTWADALAIPLILVAMCAALAAAGVGLFLLATLARIALKVIAWAWY